jgi:ribose transport system permease protein
MSAITGVALLGFSGGGFVGVGDPYLFTTVAAVVIGGTSLVGGWGGSGGPLQSTECRRLWLAIHDGRRKTAFVA